jgi:S1-C subfamily serine protease
MRVLPGGSAEKAGLQPTRRTRTGDIILGDIIVGLNGEKIKSYEDLLLAIEQYKPGQTIELSLLRNGKPLKVSLTLNESS